MDRSSRAACQHNHACNRTVAAASQRMARCAATSLSCLQQYAGAGKAHPLDQRRGNSLVRSCSSKDTDEMLCFTNLLAVAVLKVWDWGGNGCIRYRATDVGELNMGYVVENSLLQTALLSRLQKPGSAVDLTFQAKPAVQTRQLVSGNVSVLPIALLLKAGQRLITLMLLLDQRFVQEYCRKGSEAVDVCRRRRWQH